MKNIFRFLMAVAVLFTASCTKEDISSSIGGGEVEVTFTANLPELGTRAEYGTGEQVNTLRYFVYDGNTLLSDLSGEQNIAVGVPTTVNLVLLKGMTYNIVFWADCDKVYSYNTASKSVTVDYNNVVANDEKRDAFYKFVAAFDPANSTSENTNIVLTRPFAQLNAKANDVDKIKFSGVTLSTSTVTLTAYSTLNIADGTVTGADEKTLTAADILEDGLLSMNYLLAPADGYVSDIKFTINNSKNIDFGNKYYNVPLKRNYRTNILGALLTKSTDFTVSIDPVFGEPAEDLDAETQIFKVSTADELAAALTTNVEKQIENLEIILLNDIDLPIGSLGTITPGSGEYKVGNVGTDNITLNLNGKKLNITTTYWSALGAKNDNALFTIKNGTMTSSQATGTWNSYDLTFANCNYAIEDVVFEKAVAFANAGKNVDLKNITIKETHDYYAMWICAEGQNVNIDGLIINSAGRGIKIDEQYVDAPAKVTLDIANASFTTTNKAAIVVKSAAGAVINASNLNIDNVAKDKVYAVWVDEDAATYYDLVEVNGAKVRLEGSAIVTTQAELNDAVNAGKAQINLAAGNYNLPDGVKGTIIGTDKENCVVNIVKSYYGSTANTDVLTLQNLTTKLAAGFGYTEQAFGYFHHYKEVNIINCNSDRIRLNCSTANIEGCTFTLTTSSGFDGYGIYYYGNANSTVNVKDCVFNTAGKAIVIYSEHAKAYNLNVDDCTFVSSNPSTDKAAIQMHTELGISGVLKINNCTATDFAAVNGGLWNELNNQTGVLTNVFEKWVNGVQVYNDYTVSNGVYNIYTAAGLAYAATNLYKTGATINIEKDIDMTGVEYTPVVGATLLTVDGKGHTISNLKMEGVTQAALFADTNNLYVKNLTIANSTFVGKNIDGEDSAAAFVGFVEKHSSTESKIENCHVVNCTIGSAKYTGGLVGFKDGTGSLTVKDCSVKNSTIVSKYTENNGVLYKGHCGGLVGYYANPLAIDNCSVENNTFDVLGARCGLFIGSAQTDIQVSGSVKGNVGLSSLTGEINKITDWSNVNVQ